MGLYYSLSSKSGLVGYADAGFLSDPHNGRSQRVMSSYMVALLYLAFHKANNYGHIIKPCRNPSNS